MYIQHNMIFMDLNEFIMLELKLNILTFTIKIMFTYNIIYVYILLNDIHFNQYHKPTSFIILNFHYNSYQ